MRVAHPSGKSWDGDTSFERVWETHLLLINGKMGRLVGYEEDDDATFGRPGQWIKFSVTINRNVSPPDTVIPITWMMA